MFNADDGVFRQVHKKYNHQIVFDFIGDISLTPIKEINPPIKQGLLNKTQRYQFSKGSYIVPVTINPLGYLEYDAAIVQLAFANISYDSRIYIFAHSLAGSNTISGVGKGSITAEQLAQFFISHIPKGSNLGMGSYDPNMKLKISLLSCEAGLADKTEITLAGHINNSLGAAIPGEANKGRS